MASMVIGLAGDAGAGLSVHPPGTPVYQGQPVTLRVEGIGTSNQQGQLYDRPLGVRVFQRLQLDLSQSPGLDGAHHVTLPATAVVSPGLEYYVEVIGYDNTSSDRSRIASFRARRARPGRESGALDWLLHKAPKSLRKSGNAWETPLREPRPYAISNDSHLGDGK